MALLLQIKYVFKNPIDLHSFYISITTNPIDTKFGSIVTHGALMIPQQFGADRPKGGVVIEAQMPHSFQWDFQTKYIFLHN